VFAPKQSSINFLLFWCEFIRKTSCWFDLSHGRSL